MIKQWIASTILLSLLSGLAIATESISQTSSSQSVFTNSKKPYEAEASMFFYDLGESSSPLIGASVSRDVIGELGLGVRTLIPMDYKDKLSFYSFQGFFRYNFVNNGEQKLFGELLFAYNGSEKEVNSQSSFITSGLSLGLLHKVMNNISLGAVFGAELLAYSFEEPVPHLLFPKVGLTTGLNF